jgi:hypothetical protein
VSVAAAVQAASAVVSTLNAFVFAETTAVYAELNAALMVERAAIASAHAAIMEARSTSIDLDSAVQLSHAVSVALDASIQPCSCGVSPYHWALIETIARLRGVIDPLTDNPSGRGDGTVQQSYSQSGGTVTVTTLARPHGPDTESVLTPQQVQILEALARTFGVIDPLQVTATSRSDGTLHQSISTSGSTTTLTPQ